MMRCHQTLLFLFMYQIIYQKAWSKRIVLVDVYNNESICNATALFRVFLDTNKHQILRDLGPLHHHFQPPLAAL